MITLAFPDMLTWQAGIEYGIEALAVVRKYQADLRFYLRPEGPMLEGIAFTVHQLQLDGQVVYRRNMWAVSRKADLVLLPRVAPMNTQLILDLLQAGCRVLTSEPTTLPAHPRLAVFERRNWKALLILILGELE